MDEFEVTLVGGGVGECVLVHLGDGRWIIIDSCLDNGRPASLGYLERMGVDPATSVDLISISHWHDDHIRGVSSVVGACAEARFCISSGMRDRTFLQFVSAYEAGADLQEESSGTHEIVASLRALKKRADKNKRYPILASATQRVLTIQAAEWALGLPCEVWALSPSPHQLQLGLSHVASLLPAANGKEARRRAPSGGENHFSVVLMIIVGDLCCLLGGDLEEPGVVTRGWSSIHADTNRPPRLAHIFKIPHHGSENAHHDSTWSDLLVTDPHAIVAPFLAGAKPRPSKDDLRRIRGLTPNGFCTSSTQPRQSRRRPSVERMIKQTAKRLESLDRPVGSVTLRANINSFNGSIQPALAGGAFRIT